MGSGIIIVRRVDGGPLWAIGSNYYSPALVTQAKTVPGMTFDGRLRMWCGYADAVTAVVARLQYNGISIVDADTLPDPESWRESRSPYLFSTTGLRDYQVEGVRFLLARSKEGALLADGMRLGKSCQATIASRAFKQKTLVLCPSHVVGVWSRPPDAIEGPGEIAKWWPDAWKTDVGVVCLETIKPFKSQESLAKLEKKKVLTPAEAKELKEATAFIEAKVQEIQNAQVIVCHYDILYAWVEILKRWGVQTLIIDEGHILSGYKSRRSDAVKVMAGLSQRRMLLTGTPVTNSPKNLHNVLDVLAENRFGYFFGTYRDGDEITIKRGCYANVFCDAKQEDVGHGAEQKKVWNFKGRSNLDEPDGKLVVTKEETLHHRLKFLMLRRLKRDVDPQLPQKQRQIVDVIIPARQCISVSNHMLGSGGEELRRCLNLAADGKFKPVSQLVASHVAEQEKVICACYRRAFTEKLAQDVKKKVADGALVVYVHGEIPQKERDRRIHKLRQHKGPGVLVGTIDTISTGIDLSFAGVMVVGELTWDPHTFEQLEERLYAYGKDAKSLVQYVIARGTGDELIVRGILTKMDTADRTIGATKSGLKEDLGKKKEDPMKRLFAALAEMQRVPVVGKKKRAKVSKEVE